jgi:phosphoglycerate dehydrogenase-like enzyme
MSNSPLTIWCNSQLSSTAQTLLEDGTKAHQLLFAPSLASSNLAVAPPDPALAGADIAFGQPDAQSVIANTRIRWVHLTTAGYTRYDNEEVREAVRGRGAMLTNSSGVYAEPCAQHAVAFMLAQARQLPQALDEQRTSRGWPSLELRARSRLLNGQRVVMLSFGAIARRIAELLAPFEMNLSAVRRTRVGDEAVDIVAPSELPDQLAAADHVINILPDNPSTRGFVNSEILKQIKPGAVFYNIGRGTTVDQSALLTALRSGRLGAAYLDVTDPEPLPADHPLWTAPNCFITPHTAGGFAGEDDALVRHFLANLGRFVQGAELVNRVI